MKKGLSYFISDEIFQRFPGYVRGVVVAENVQNRPSPNELIGLMREVELSLRNRLDLGKIAEHPRIKSWRDAYRAFGARPGEFRSSIEALTRRILRGDGLPSINALVDIGNVVSLRHLIPAGGHAIDMLEEDIALRFAAGEEEFIPFGSDQIEHPLPGEVIFAEGNAVLTRRWTWRQANHTLTVLETEAIEFNLDALPPVPQEEIEETCQEVIDLMSLYCGGQARYELLTERNPKMRLSVEKSDQDFQN
ncbi:MAG: hypothetical protein EHM41_14255 [Chloroflexi bacterium]|nr:MAG: hypothetical protein EHM41_14255 [Chloroflexota bacterium]